MIPRPDPAMANFGMRVRAGDVDGDERPDLAEGAPSRGGATGHATYCRSGRRGPVRCRPLPSAGGSSGLAMGDVNGDGRADIVQGDSEHVGPAEGPPVGSGLVRVWFGAPGGPRADARSRSPRTARRSRAPRSPATSSAPSSRPATSTRTGSRT